MRFPRWFFAAAIAAIVVPAARAQTSPMKPATTKAAAPLNGVSFGASIGMPMMVSASDYLYNYADYSPAGLGVRYGVSGALRLRVSGLDKANPAFAFIADGRYATLFHTTKSSPSSSNSSSARFGMLSFGLGLEQALGAGRMQPFFGLTMDVNAIEPGTVRTTTLDSAGYHTVNGSLAGDIWQMRFGVTPRMGFRVMMTRSLMFDFTFAYQVVNILNRADLTPKNYLVDSHGKESLITQASASLGIMWTMPTMKGTTTAAPKRK